LTKYIPSSALNNTMELSTLLYDISNVSRIYISLFKGQAGVRKEIEELFNQTSVNPDAMNAFGQIFMDIGIKGYNPRLKQDTVTLN